MMSKIGGRIIKLLGRLICFFADWNSIEIARAFAHPLRHTSLIRLLVFVPWIVGVLVVDVHKRPKSAKK